MRMWDEVAKRAWLAPLVLAACATSPAPTYEATTPPPTNYPGANADASGSEADAAAPDAIGFTAMAGDASVSLSWDDDGDSYELWRRHGQNAATLVAKTAASSHVDRDVTNGVTYHYALVVVAGGKQVSAFQEISATPGWLVLRARPTLSAAAEGNGTLLVAGRDGFVLRSTDGGTTFAESAVTDTSHVRALAFGNGTFVAVGDGIFTSPDGLAWARSSASFDGLLHALLFDGAAFVAVGQGGAILRSVDNGATWASHALAVTNDLYGVAVGNDGYVAVGDGGIVASSSNGTSWGHSYEGTLPLSDVLHDGARFVAVGLGGRVLTSSDGTLWSSTLVGGAPELRGIALVGGELVAVGDGIYTSPNATTWTARAIDAKHRFEGAIAVAGRLFAFGQAHTLYTSADGVSWQRAREDGNLTAMAATTARLVAVGSGGLILGSTDAGATFTAQTLSARPQLNDVASGGDAFAAVGDGGLIYTASDGSSWIERTAPGLTSDLTAVAFGAGIWVAVGAAGRTVVSSDGLSWSANTALSGAPELLDVTYGNGRFVAVGSQGSIYTSSDGVDWSPATSGLTDPLVSVVYGATNAGWQFLAFSGGATFASSPDGITWVSSSTSTSVHADAVFANDRFLLTSVSNLVESVDGIEFDARRFGATSNTLRALAVGANGTVYAVGDDGMILRRP